MRGSPIFNSISVTSSRGLRSFPACGHASVLALVAGACNVDRPARPLYKSQTSSNICLAVSDSPLCARLPARLSPRVRFGTRIQQTALMPDPCQSVLELLLCAGLLPRESRYFRRDRLIEAARSHLLSHDNALFRRKRPSCKPAQTQSRTLTCRCARSPRSNRLHCERISPFSNARQARHQGCLRDNRGIKLRFFMLRLRASDSTMPRFVCRCWLS